MLLSKLTKYLHLKSKITSPKQPKSSEVTCVQSEEIRNSELEIRNKENVEEASLPLEGKVSAKPTDEVYPEAEPKSTTSHLSGSVPRRVETPRGAMTKSEMREARELFEGLDDAEIHRLYKKVTQ